jgi:SAM-dependent methyltransferase
MIYTVNDNNIIVNPWKFDKSIADDFSNHARKHIPGYDRVIDKSVNICCHMLNKDSSIIDVGCAIGETLERLHQNGFKNLYGVDNSNDMLDKANPNIAKLILSNKLPNVNYDAVLLNWTLHFIEDKKTYLDSVYANLNHGGFLILSDKTCNHAPYLNLYHEDKRNHGVSIKDIEDKARSLTGKMFINDQQWYQITLTALGFNNISIIDADWCFTTFIAWK